MRRVWLACFRKSFVEVLASADGDENRTAMDKMAIKKDTDPPSEIKRKNLARIQRDVHDKSPGNLVKRHTLAFKKQRKKQIV